MGDFITNYDIFKKLGFDGTNRWIFYDERFASFFEFFADKISDCNVLSEHEVLARDELIARKEFLQDAELVQRLRLVERERPGLIDSTERQVEVLNNSVNLLTTTVGSYESMLDDMRTVKDLHRGQLSITDDSIRKLRVEEKLLISKCQEKAKKLEELQLENYKISSEAKQCFTKSHSPPLFMHQMPLDQYFLKFESFMQYFTLYVKENFNVQAYIDLNRSGLESKETAIKLEQLQKCFKHYTLEYIKETSKVRAMQKLIEQLDLTRIHVISLNDMVRETHDLQLLKEHHFSNAYDTLLSDLEGRVQQEMQQRMELVLYENTKLKFERALQRHESDATLSTIISNALATAELLWITMQLDMERRRNLCENTEKELLEETVASMRRLRTMHLSVVNEKTDVVNIGGGGGFATIPCNVTYPYTLLLNQIAKVVNGRSNNIKKIVRVETKGCLYEYEKFNRFVAYSTQNLLNRMDKIPYQLQDLDKLVKILTPFVYDGPVRTPMFEHVRLLQPIFKIKQQQEMIEKSLRSLRTEFHENITKRMENDKFWYYSQLLWLWFLTEPKRVQHAIDEVKRAASQMPSMTGAKALGGIKRKNNSK